MNSPGPCCPLGRSGGANGGFGSGATEGGAGGFSTISGARKSLVNSPGPSGGFSAFEAGSALGLSGSGETGPGAFGMGMSLPKKTFVNSPGSPFALEGGGVATGGFAAFGVAIPRALSSEARVSCFGCGDDTPDALRPPESLPGADLGTVVFAAVFSLPAADRSHCRRS